MPDIIRVRQRVVTSLFPHNANRRFLIPKLGKPVVAGPSKTYTMTAGGTTTRGFLRGSYGSISPDETFESNDTYTFQRLTTTAGGDLQFRISPPSAPNNDATWEELEIAGEFAGGPGTVTIARSDTVYLANSGGQSRWDISTSVIVSGNTYTVTIRWLEL